MGTGIALIFRPSPTPATVTILPHGIPPAKASLIARWIPPTWTLIWRLKEAIAGPRKTVTLYTTIIAFESVSNLAASLLSSEAVRLTDTNGLQVWVLGDSALEALRHRLEQRARFTSHKCVTADGIEARMSVTTGFPRNFGDYVDLLPRLRGDATDLSAVILRTEPGSEMPSTRTNLLVSARIQIPKGSGVFLLKNSSEISDGKTFGVLISVTLLPRRK